MNRKDFIQQIGIACISCSAAATWLEGCVGIHYAQHQWDGKEKKIMVKTSEFHDEKHNKDRKFVVVRDEQLDFPVYVWKNTDGYIALYMCCTHKGCELNPQNEFLICPCHGSEFDRFGKVQNPPADRDLLRFEVKEEGEYVCIFPAH